MWYKGAVPTGLRHSPLASKSARDKPENPMKLIHAAVTLLGLCLAVNAAAQTKWDMPTAYPATNFHTENIMQFVADVEKATGGKLKITVHANASLFKANEIKRAVQTEQAQIGEILISGYSNEDPLFGADSIPFLASSYADAVKLWNASRKTIEDRFAKQGMRILYAVPWPPQGIYSNKPIASIADMKGLKMRTYNPATSRIAELAGAQPVTIQAAELAQAMATGAVNANITSGATGYDSKAWEQVKYFYDTQAWLPKNVVFVNEKSFAALDKASQDAVLKAAADAEARGWKVSEEKTKWYLEQLAKNGMTVAPPSPALAADFKKIGETMTSEWTKQAGPDGQAIVDAYKKM
jgi:TRAP-type C4-dicarboxylate transport system substrate-binding protein